MPSVLVIDDDKPLNGFITRGLTRAGFVCDSALNGADALTLLEQKRFDVLVCDWNLGDMDGLDILRRTTQLDPPPPFIMITAFGNVQVAVDAMKLGAADFLEKPVSLDLLSACIQGAVNRAKVIPAESAQPKPSPGTGGLVGSERWLSPFMQLLDRIARTDTIVLIEGETGTGKSAVARELWRRSARHDQAFVELNCGALPDNLVERELFGNEKGAYTGAETPHRGKVSQADEGTLFLDEIGELPLLLQPKLLHLLSERSYQPLGSTESVKANVRFIAATNRDLEQAVADSQFRPDLYFRLNVMRLAIPPLRERTDDIPVLVEHFRSGVAERVRHDCPEFTPDAMQALMSHEWPGNVRELENLVEMMAIMVGPDRPVEATDLPSPFLQGRRNVIGNHRSGAPEATRGAAEVTAPSLDPDDSQSLKQAVASYERTRIVNALQQEAGNRTKAAKRLGVKRTTLIEKINRLGITSEEYGESEDDR